MQPIITSLKEQKYSDLKEFQTAFAAFQADKKKAFDEIADFVKSTPFLENCLSSDLFAQNDPNQFIFYEPFVQLDIRRFNEDL